MKELKRIVCTCFIFNKHVFLLRITNFCFSLFKKNKSVWQLFLSTVKKYFHSSNICEAYEGRHVDKF